MSQRNNNDQYSADKLGKPEVSSNFPASGEANNKNYHQQQRPESYLFAFDFDNTVVHENSDVVITKLAHQPLPDEVKSFYNGTNWTEFMNVVFKFLHGQGVSVSDICKFVGKMEPTKGMLSLLTWLVQLKTASSGVTTENNSGGEDVVNSSEQSPSIHVLVISDANDLFISEFLKAQVLDPLLSSNLNDGRSSTPHRPSPFDIITNKSVVVGNNTDATLSILPYEFQTTCKSCPKNLCKGAAIEKFIQSKGPFTKVFYTGDGRNDVCPALKLRQHDCVFVRRNYHMHKMVQKSKNSLGISARIVLWDDAHTIQSTIISETSCKL